MSSMTTGSVTGSGTSSPLLLPAMSGPGSGDRTTVRGRLTATCATYIGTLVPSHDSHGRGERWTDTLDVFQEQSMSLYVIAGLRPAHLHEDRPSDVPSDPWWSCSDETEGGAAHDTQRAGRTRLGHIEVDRVVRRRVQHLIEGADTPSDDVPTTP